jgi:hypothetical protein
MGSWAWRFTGVPLIKEAVSMTANRKLYPSKTVWEAMRRERLEQVGFQCELCGLPDATECYNPNKPHPFYQQGTPYRLYLQFAHKRQYETWNREADGVMLCPSCHGKFDTQFRRKRSVRYPSSVGLVVVWVWYRGERCLAAETRYFDDLLEVIASFAEGWRFEVYAEVLMQVAGVGRYQKEVDGVTVVQEEGVCESFGLFLHEVLSGVVG